MSAEPSYADMAAKGPKQTPEEAAAPQPPQVESASASTASLIDVDTPSVRTVPSDFADQDVQTETQAERLEQEHAAAKKGKAVKHKSRRSGGSGSASSSARDKAAHVASEARRADGWLVGKIAGLSDRSAGALMAGNLAAVMGLGAALGYKAWALHERAALNWKGLGLGLGLLGVVGLGEGIFASAYYKARGKKQ